MLILFFFSSTVRSQQAANGQLVSAMPPLRRRSRFIGGVTSIPVTISHRIQLLVNTVVHPI